jgi:Protein of unknown function DUF262/HNH endonuclease
MAGLKEAAVGEWDLPGINYRPITKTIRDIRNLYRDKNLNLCPGFQRKSVWIDKDRKSLIDSILSGYPIPAIFLYTRIVNGKTIYDVIDGKQRIETILRFTKLQKPSFTCRAQIGSSTAEIDWAYLNKKHMQYRIEDYELSVIEVDGTISDTITLFVRINSTGKALSAQEKRHAQYYNSTFLQNCSRLAERLREYFKGNRIMTEGQLARMKHVEFICELMLSLHSGSVLNKKSALDKAMMQDAIDGRSLHKAQRLTERAIKTVVRMFPDVRTTRFCKISDFYTISVLIGQYEQRGLVLNNKRRNTLAWDLLKNFGRRVDEISEKQKHVAGTTAEDGPFREYLLTVLRGTDELNQRKKRESLIDSLIGSIFEKKDSQRLFSAVQRRMIWNSAAEKICTQPGCKTALTWENFTVDHINPYAKGGATRLQNAALMCREHNSAKGSRRPVVRDARWKGTKTSLSHFNSRNHAHA